MRIEACGFAKGEYFTLVFVFVSVSGVTYASKDLSFHNDI